MAIRIAPSIIVKLAKKHNVTRQEIDECFLNRTGVCLIDDREDHRTEPPTRWFIAKTDMGRELKIVFIPYGADLVVKTAYPPEPDAKRIYEEYHR